MTRIAMMALVVCVAACGGSGGSGGGGGGAGGGGSATGGGSASGGGSATGGGTASGKAGAVTVTQIDLPSGPVHSATAAFYPGGAPSISGGPACTFSTVDGCQISDCVSDGGIPMVDAGMPASAGDLTAQVGSTAAVTLTRSSVTGQYNAPSTMGSWWTGGETVTISATGDASGVPSFSGSFPAPTAIVVTQPAAGNFTFQRNSELTILWSGTANQGTVTVNITTGQLAGGHAVLAACTGPASANSLTISQNVTQLLLAGNGLMQFSNRTGLGSVQGDWNITLGATSISESRTLTVQ